MLLADDRQTQGVKQSACANLQLVAVLVRRKRVGGPHRDGLSLESSTTMVVSLISSIVYLCWLSLTSQPILVSGTISESSAIVTGNNSLTFDRDRCNQFEDWIDEGIDEDDCRAAMAELHNDDVVPRQGQKYDFLRHGTKAHQHGYYPWVITPRKHWYREWRFDTSLVFQIVA